MKMLVAIGFAATLCACVPRFRYLEVMNAEFTRISETSYFHTCEAQYQGVEIRLNVSSTDPGYVRVYLGVRNRSHGRISFDLADLKLEGDGQSYGLTSSTIDRCCADGETVRTLAKGKNWYSGLILENKGATNNCDLVDLWLPEITVVGTGETIEFEKITARVPEITE